MMEYIFHAGFSLHHNTKYKLNRVNYQLVLVDLILVGLFMPLLFSFFILLIIWRGCIGLVILLTMFYCAKKNSII
jgi:hypothetical protein